jgi:hypothetical protein
MVWRKALPVAISLGLITWLASRISLGGLAKALVVLPCNLLIPMTAALVVALYLWDSLCLITVFSTGPSRLTYTDMLRARGKSYLWGAWNQGLGQAAVAWHVARARQISLRAALTGSIILSWHEGVILSVTGLAGSWWVGDPRLARMKAFCAALLAVLVGIAMILRLLPSNGRQWLQRRPWGAALAAWDARRSMRLILLRVVYFGVSGIYVVAALWLCGQGIGLATALVVVPLVLLATILPSASGLGARETALYLLIPSSQPDVLVAMGVLWSTGVIIVRLLIGLGWLWFDRADTLRETSTSHTGLETAKRPPAHDSQLDRLRMSRGGIDI